MTITILFGDCRQVLATIAPASVQCCVTSPPYFGLRDYGVAGQIGLEPTLAEYVAEMVAVFAAVRRVLRDDGTCWLNLGDAYSRSPTKGGSGPGGTIATQSYSGAHFATMPPDLAERCIKAGTKPGDMVLDPFGGAGTTGLVADRLGRDATLIELNPAYASLARKRITDDAPLIASVA